MDIRIMSIFKGMAHFIYFFLKLLKTKNKITFISRVNRKTSIDFQLLKEEIEKRDKNVKIVILNHKLRTRPYLIIDVLIEMYHIATSKACIVDSYVIPISILNHKESLTVIQIWHALGAIKKFGHASLDKEEGAKKEVAQVMNMHRNYDFIIAGGKATVPFYSQAFGTKKVRIIPYSLPRIDYLVNAKNKQEAREKRLKMCVFLL